MVLGGRVGQVVEDYDASKCSAFYNDSGFVSSSPRPEAVSITNHTAGVYMLPLLTVSVD